MKEAVGLQWLIIGDQWVLILLVLFVLGNQFTQARKIRREQRETREFFANTKRKKD